MLKVEICQSGILDGHHIDLGGVLIRWGVVTSRGRRFIYRSLSCSVAGSVLSVQCIDILVQYCETSQLPVPVVSMDESLDSHVLIAPLFDELMS